MPIVNRIELGRELVKTLGHVNLQIQEVVKLAKDMECEPHAVRDTRGGFLLAPLLVSKTQLLHALVLINKE